MKPPLHVDHFVQQHPRLIFAKGRPVITAGMATDQAYYLISGHAKSKKPQPETGKAFLRLVI